MKYTSGRRRAAVLTVMASLLIAGCTAGGHTSASPGQLEKRDLVVAAVPALDSAALYIAQQRGLFAQQGLHVKIEKAISGATVINGQMAGKYDVTLGNYVSYILHNAQLPAKAPQNKRFQILAAASIMAPNTQVLVVPPGSPIHSIADLTGKRIGVNVPKNIGYLLVSSTLSDNAMSVKANHIHFVSIEFPKMAAALKDRQVDAAWLPEPFITSAEMDPGAQLLADMDQGSTENLPIAGFLVTQAWLHKYPHTAAAFRRAILEGQQIAGSNLNAIKKGVETYAGVPGTVAAIVTADQYPLVTDPRGIQRVADLMLQFGLLGQAYNVSQMLPSG